MKIKYQKVKKKYIIDTWTTLESLIHRAKSNKLDIDFYHIWFVTVSDGILTVMPCSMCYWKLVSNGVCVATNCPCLVEDSNITILHATFGS